jgi:purine-binding chemotaxis protein CheW
MSDSLYCTFHSAGRLFGVPVLDVKEVTNHTTFTQVPHTPQEVLGLVNIRGQIFLAINLASLLAYKEHGVKPNSQFIVFKPSVGHSFGIVVDQVGEMISVADSQSEKFSTGLDFGRDANDQSVFVSHVCKLENQLLIVLDPRKFLNRIEQSFRTTLNNNS